MVFDIALEIDKYLRSDVDIQSSLQFGEIVMQITGIEALILIDEEDLEYYLQDSGDPVNYIMHGRPYQKNCESKCGTIMNR